MNVNLPFAAVSAAELIIQLERLALHTWPASSTVVSGPWMYRVSGGITKRANSVWTAAGPSFPDGDWLAEAEQYYREREQPVLFHISDASPRALDEALAANGYAKEVPCSVLVARTDTVVANTGTDDAHPFRVTVRPQYDEAWLSSFLRMEGFGEERRAFYRQLFAQLTPLAGFFMLELDGRSAAVGTSVVEEGWAGFINIAVDASLRGQGIGRRLLNEMAVWSRCSGAEGLYLQVADDNEAALRLYAKAGYTRLYRYHYRCKNI
ncbi:GNAT family N-acetyltransferase [Paenibacillus piri]|uniref:GNAT family N-acetyltransferase n=1 Tax=Paenibacillus piri TaxID=2547395 RepID=A0A4R5KWJ9_9BACL|nr:GNAT family N-acetyltransferase [Paenibacillus piri]TDF99558.1 GNAT family N-acetyltransferase [Paenibacillus piri]